MDVLKLKLIEVGINRVWIKKNFFVLELGLIGFSLRKMYVLWNWVLKR